MTGEKQVPYRLKKDRRTGKLYLVKEWYNPRKKDKETISIGPVDEIEHLVLTLKKQLGIKRLQKVTEKLVRRPGFEPGITGLEGMELALGDDGVFPQLALESGDFGLGRTLGKPSWDALAGYLRSKKPPVTSGGQLRAYRSWWEKLPGVIEFSRIGEYCGSNKHCLNLVNHMANYLWQIGVINAEDKLRVNEIVRNLRPVVYSRHSSEKIIDIGLVARDIKRLAGMVGGDSGLIYTIYIIYKTLFYSGLRLVEAVFLLYNINNYVNPVARDDVNTRGHAVLGDTVRLNIFWTRGKKHLDHAWLPKDLFHEIKEQGFTTGKAVERLSNNISTWTRKHGFINPSDIRDAHYQFMQKLKAPGKVPDAIQNRFTEKSVSETYYSQTVILADEFYEKHLFPELNKILEKTRGE